MDPPEQPQGQRAQPSQPCAAWKLCALGWWVVTVRTAGAPAGRAPAVPSAPSRATAPGSRPTGGKGPRPVPPRDVLGVVCVDCPEQCWVGEHPMPVGVWAREHTRRHPTHRQYQVAPQVPRPRAVARPPRPVNRVPRTTPPVAVDRARPGRSHTDSGVPGWPRSAVLHPTGLGTAVMGPLLWGARAAGASSGPVDLARLARWGGLSVLVVGWGLGLGALLPLGPH